MAFLACSSNALKRRVILMLLSTGLTLGKKSNKSKHFHLSAKNGKIFNRKTKKKKKTILRAELSCSKMKFNLPPLTIRMISEVISVFCSNANF